MSYLLKSEVELDKQRENFSLLSAKIDQLFSMQQSSQQQQQLSLFNKSTNPSLATPLPSHASHGSDSEDLLRTERSDKTVNLFEHHTSPSASSSRSPSSVYATPYSDLSSSAHSTPYSNPVTENAAATTSANRKKGQVTFSLPNSSSPSLSSSLHGQQSESPSVPFRESKLGTSSTDWLFQTTKDMFSPAAPSPQQWLQPHQQQPQQQLLPISQMDPSTRFGSTNGTTPPTHRDHGLVSYSSTSTPPSGSSAPTSSVAPPNRMTELQHQLAIMRHDVSGVKGYGITKELPLSSSPASFSSSTSAATGSSYHSDPLRQWLKWTGESPQRHGSADGYSPKEINQLPIPPPPPASVPRADTSSMTTKSPQRDQGPQAQLDSKAIHIPRAQIPPKNFITEESDSEQDREDYSEGEHEQEQEEEEEIPLHQIYNPSQYPTPSPSSKFASYLHQQPPPPPPSGALEEEEPPSQHCISSTLLPTPERAPQHPHGSTPSSRPQQQVPLYPPSAKSPPSTVLSAASSPSSTSPFAPKFQRSYDARNGSYGAR
jgi:hypothetical protein